MEKKRGRPPIGHQAMLQPMTIRFPEQMMLEIEAIMEKRMDKPEKGQVVRELVAAALEARGK